MYNKKFSLLIIFPQYIQNKICWITNFKDEESKEELVKEEIIKEEATEDDSNEESAKEEADEEAAKVEDNEEEEFPDTDVKIEFNR